MAAEKKSLLKDLNYIVLPLSLDLQPDWGKPVPELFIVLDNLCCIIQSCFVGAGFDKLKALITNKPFYITIQCT